SSLQCYHCYSYESFHECDNNKELKSCEIGAMQRCSKVTYDLPIGKVYRKECIDLAYCKDNDRYCRQVTNGSDDCEVHCCKDDKCNAGSKVSSGVLCACALLMGFLIRMIL
ncbi:hypothetical protein AC249_AIPGENE13756, partial [Exaiptasia diaphana]